MKFAPSNVAWLASIVVASIASADTIYQGSLPTPGAKITRIDGEQLVYEINGREAGKDVAKVTKINVSSEGPLNAAEDAFASGNWDDAVDAYQKTIQTASKPWIKDWSARRLLDAAQKSGRFDAAVSAYIVTLLKDPAVAAQHKPTLPDAQSTYLTTAIDDVRNTLNDATLSNEQKKALTTFLVELYHAKGDKAAEDAAYQQLAKVPGAAESDPNLRRMAAQRNLDSAAAALSAGNVEQALQQVGDPAALPTAGQQVDAMFLIAEAHDKLAGENKTKLQDAALDYMRLVAMAKDQPNRPHVVQSLIRTAEILKQVGDADSSRRLYQQIASQYPDDPAAATARQQNP